MIVRNIPLLENKLPLQIFLTLTLNYNTILSLLQHPKINDSTIRACTQLNIRVFDKFSFLFCKFSKFFRCS